MKYIRELFANWCFLQDIRFIVSEALQTFDEDKTGQADFALEALGGSVITVGCTGLYYLI